MSDVITALKRLERAGSEDSRQTEKLLNACDTLAKYINYILPESPEDFALPRGYVAYYQSRGMPHLLLVRDKVTDTVSSVRPIVTRRQAMQFAADIAGGWLDELSQWLEDRGAESATAAETLSKAAEAMR